MPSLKKKIMQNRNVITIFAVVFNSLFYQLSFTWIADRVEKDAIEYASSFDENEREIKRDFI